MVLSCVAAGCGSSDSGRGRYVSGVDGNRDVSTLDTMAKQQLCATFDTHVSTYVDLEAVAYVSCIPAAIWTSITPAACSQKLADCMAIFPKPITVDATLHSDNACFASLAQCQTTVAQLEGCVDVSLDRALSILDTWTCDLAGNPGSRQVAAPTPDTRVCTSVNAACNQFAAIGPE